MKFCSKCGKELLDEAVVCPGCKCTIDSTESTDVSTARPKHSWWHRLTKRKKRIICRVFVPVISVVLILGILAILILPHPDLKMKDFKDDGYIGALFHYGIPSWDMENYWAYDDCIQFYGIPASTFKYYPDDRCVFYFDDEYKDDVYDEIQSHCDFEENLSDLFHIFSYGNLEISYYLPTGDFTIRFY